MHTDAHEQPDCGRNFQLVTGQRTSQEPLLGAALLFGSRYGGKNTPHERFARATTLAEWDAARPARHVERDLHDYLSFRTNSVRNDLLLVRQTCSNGTCTTSCSAGQTFCGSVCCPAGSCSNGSCSGTQPCPGAGGNSPEGYSCLTCPGTGGPLVGTTITACCSPGHTCCSNLIAG